MGLLACGELALVGLFLWQGSSLGWIRWLSSASCDLLISRRPAYTYPMIVTGVQQSEKKLQGIWWPKLIFSMMSLPKVLLAKASLEANTDPWNKEVDSAAVGRAAKALYRGHMSRERWKIEPFLQSTSWRLWRSSEITHTEIFEKIYNFMQGINIFVGVSFFLSMGWHGSDDLSHILVFTLTGIFTQ